MNLLEYPKKVILALGEAITGNKKILQWFLDNQYPELAAYASAVRGSDDAVQWLVKNKFPELAALDAALSKDAKAYQWLHKYNFTFYILLAEACQGKPLALVRLKKEPEMEVFFLLAMKTKYFFDNQTYDYHKKPSNLF